MRVASIGYLRVVILPWLLLKIHSGLLSNAYVPPTLRWCFEQWLTGREKVTANDGLLSLNWLTGWKTKGLLRLWSVNS